MVITVVRSASAPESFTVEEGTTLASFFEGKSFGTGASLYVNGIATKNMQQELASGDTILVVGRVYNG